MLAEFESVFEGRACGMGGSHMKDTNSPGSVEALVYSALTLGLPPAHLLEITLLSGIEDLARIDPHSFGDPNELVDTQRPRPVEKPIHRHSCQPGSLRNHRLFDLQSGSDGAQLGRDGSSDI